MEGILDVLRTGLRLEQRRSLLLCSQHIRDRNEAISLACTDN